MSWSSFIAAGSTYAAACSAIWVGAAHTEKVLKKGGLEAVANAIRSSAMASAVIELPKQFIRIFGRVFTERVFSLRGFSRSAIASLIFVTCLLLYAWSQIPEAVNVTLTFREPPPPPPPSGSGADSGSWAYLVGLDFHTKDGFPFQLPVVSLFLLPLLYNICADFFAIVLTQRALTAQLRLSTRQRLLAFLLTAIALLFTSYVFFVLSMTVSGVVEWIVEGYKLDNVLSTLGSDFSWNTRLYGMALLFPFSPRFATHFLPQGSAIPPSQWTPYVIYGAYVYSTFVGLAWLGFVMIASLLSAGAHRMHWVGPWIDKYFDLEKYPMKVGAVLLIVVFTIVYWPLFFISR